MKVYVRAPMSEIRLRELQELFEEVVYDPWNKTGERFYEKEMLEALKTVQPDILITELDRITEAVVSNYKGLKVISDCRANPANIDVEACSAHGIPVLCTPARNATAVAEMLVGMLIAYMRKLLPATAWVRDGQWIEGTTPYYTWMGNELCGKKVSGMGVYITNYGSKYHMSMSCGGLKRKIYAVPISETAGKGACSKCGK